MATRKSKPVSSTKVVKITPAIAREMLEKNTRNRKVKDRHVAALANDMLKGRWEFNGESVKIATDGVILDGQHRLRAIVESRTSQELLVTTGLNKNTFKTIDIGAKRSGFDTMDMRGLKHAAVVSTVCRLIAVHEERDTDDYIGSVISRRGLRPVSNAELVEVEKRFPELKQLISDVVVPNLVETSLWLSSSNLAFLYWLFSTKNKKHATEFFHRFEHGSNEPTGSPILALRRYCSLLAAKGKLLQAEREQLTAATIVAWNAFRTGENIDRIKLGKYADAVRPK